MGDNKNPFESIKMLKLAVSLLVLSAVILAENHGRSEEQAKKVASEREALEAASLRYEREITEARKAYDEAAKQAAKKLLIAYDASIASAMKRGGGDALDLANELNTERKKFQAKVEKDQASHSKDPATSISLDKLKKLLTAKTWYFHWEEQPPSRNHPLRFLPNGHVVGDPGGNWAIEPMWVIKNAGSYHVLIDDKTIRGFFVPTGRQTGMIAD